MMLIALINPRYGNTFPIAFIKTVFDDWSSVLKHKQDICFYFLAHKILRTIFILFFSKFFQFPIPIFVSHGKLIPLTLYLLIKGLTFIIIISDFFLIFYDLTRMLMNIENIFSLFYW